MFVLRFPVKPTVRSVFASGNEGNKRDGLEGQTVGAEHAATRLAVGVPGGLVPLISVATVLARIEMQGLVVEGIRIVPRMEDRTARCSRFVRPITDSRLP